MKLISAHIEGFRSFVEPVTVEFQELTGLVFLTGRNEVEPTLEGNGVGKSTLFEAIYWCLFGKTSRGLKAGDIKNWHSQATPTVEVVLEVQGAPLTVHRSWNPNCLQITAKDGTCEDVDQGTVEKTIRVSADTFLYSVYFAQFVPMFLDLSPNGQMSLLSEVLNLDHWERAADHATKEARSLEDVLHKHEVELSNIRGQLRAFEEQVEQVEEEQLDVARRRYYGALSMSEAVKEAEKDLAELEQAVRKARGKIERGLQEDKKELAQLAQQQSDLNLENGALAGTEYEVKRQITKAEQLGKGLGAVCPTCHQKVDHSLLKEEAAKGVEELTRDLKRVQDKRAKITGQLNEVLAKAREAARRADAQQYKELEAMLAKLKDAEGRVRDCGEDLLRIVDSEIPEIPAALQRRVEALTEVQQKLCGSLQSDKTKMLGLRYWQKEFKELRLYLIEESLTQLEVEANSALHELGLEGWYIEFDVERETKGGKVKQGFSVLIYSPTTDRLVPWAAWSGGESQRLRLAVAMGLSSLICSRLGMAPNIEFWDEPSTWLSTSGITDLLQALKSKAEREGKQIWLADHRSFDYGGFVKTVTITKTQQGSSFTPCNLPTLGGL